MRKKFRTTKEYTSYFRRLVLLERDAEKQFHIKEIKHLSGKEREKRGRAILRLRAKAEGELVGGFKLYRFSRSDMPDHQINVGDVVLVSRKNPLKEGVEGTVYEKGTNYLTVAFSGEITLKTQKSLYRIDLYINDITFRRMLDTLTLIENQVSAFPIDTVLGQGKIKVGVWKAESPVLNKFQNDALRKALGSHPLFLIHGPPGTGKTTTLVEIIHILVKQKKKILATADSNNAVDNIVDGLLKRSVNVTRIGHPARLNRELLEVSLDRKIERHELFSKIQEINREIETLRGEQEKFKKPVPMYRRGLSDEEILGLAKKGKGSRGVSARTIKLMAEWIKRQKKVNEFYRRKMEIYERIVKDVLDKSSVICTTNSTAGSDILLSKTFDVGIIDEATQSTEPSCLIPLVKCKKVIMAGDHRQLPPTILNPEAYALSFTMFERFIEIYPQASSMLKIQYRMNEKIMAFPSIEFYNGELVAHESVKSIKLSDIAPRKVDDPALDDTPVVFVDTGGRFLEKVKSGSFSKYNPEEAKIVKRLVKGLISMGVSPQDIGVITPYRDHEDYLKQKLKDVEIHTIDGFQGREKEVIILSLVRSNPDQEIGFLSDLRRLNVAITRARRKLIIIGDIKTLKSHNFYRKLISYIERNGKIVSR